MSRQKPLGDVDQSLPENSNRKRPASERKIQANRRNALRSTGPKTTRGKRTVARNAVTHGLLAREVVLTNGDGEESLEEFHALIEKLWEVYEPVGVIEEVLVETIATCWWRKARVIRAENGEIRRQLDTMALDRTIQASDKVNLVLAVSNTDLGFFSRGIPADKMPLMEQWATMQDAQTTLRGHCSGLAYLSALLRTAKLEISTEGYMSERVRKELFLAYCFWDYLFAITCSSARPPEAKAEGVSSEDVVDKQTEKRVDIVAYIDQQLKRVGALQEYTSERERLKCDAEARSFSLPPAGTTDRLLRYEAHLDRQLYRAMDQLERVQRQRRGEHVPPPLNINLGKRT